MHEMPFAADAAEDLFAQALRPAPARHSARRSRSRSWPAPCPCSTAACGRTAIPGTAPQERHALVGMLGEPLLHRAAEAVPARQHQPALRPAEHPGDGAQVLDRAGLLARGRPAADVQRRDLVDDGRVPEIVDEAVGLVDQAAIGLEGERPRAPPSPSRYSRARRAAARAAAGSPPASRRPGFRGCGGRPRRWNICDAIISPCSVMRICAVHRAAGLREDRLVARAAAAADRAAAAVEQAQAHAVALEHVDEPDLGLVELPARGDEAAILVAVGIAEHHLLHAAAAVDEAAVIGQRQHASMMRPRGLQILDGLEQRHDVDGAAARTDGSGRPPSAAPPTSSMSDMPLHFEMMHWGIASAP